jgi:hypothetical protein
MPLRHIKSKAGHNRQNHHLYLEQRARPCETTWDVQKLSVGSSDLRVSPCCMLIAAPATRQWGFIDHVARVSPRCRKGPPFLSRVEIRQGYPNPSRKSAKKNYPAFKSFAQRKWTPVSKVQWLQTWWQILRFVEHAWEFTEMWWTRGTYFAGKNGRSVKIAPFNIYFQS